MAFYRECPRCGCSLDPGEKCDCQEIDEQKKIDITKFLKPDRDGQICLNLNSGGGIREKVAL